MMPASPFNPSTEAQGRTCPEGLLPILAVLVDGVTRSLPELERALHRGPDGDNKTNGQWLCDHRSRPWQRPILLQWRHLAGERRFPSCTTRGEVVGSYHAAAIC